MTDTRKKFQFAKSPYSHISINTLKYNPTERIINLSRPRIKREHLIREGGF
jgi:hypothetical protein